MRRISRCLSVGLALLIWVVISGCAQKSPEDRVADIRSRYSARLNGFILDEEPLVTEVPELEAVEIEATEEGEILDFEEAVGEEIEVVQNVQLDILIQHRSVERLPGVTVEITMVDSEESEKGRWLAWFDTSQVPKATVTQFTHILEDPGYEEGDGFFVEIRHPIPAEEWADYREFSEIP